MNKMHCGATTYYRHNSRIDKPKSIPIPFPAQKIAVFSNNAPVVTNIDEFLQTSERKQEQADYFENKIDIDKKGKLDMDTYTMGRVLQRNKHRHSTYSKIIHEQLNTMTVNKKWKLGSDICPVCHNASETWYHLLTCQHSDLTRVRGDFITEFRKIMNKNNTYPPLRDFLIDCIRYPSFEPPGPPLIGNPLFANLISEAYTSQTWIGWTNFYRGYVSKYWKRIQYRY